MVQRFDSLQIMIANLVRDMPEMIASQTKELSETISKMQLEIDNVKSNTASFSEKESRLPDSAARSTVAGGVCESAASHRTPVDSPGEVVRDSGSLRTSFDLDEFNQVLDLGSQSLAEAAQETGEIRADDRAAGYTVLDQPDNVQFERVTQKSVFQTNMSFPISEFTTTINVPSTMTSFLSSVSTAPPFTSVASSLAPSSSLASVPLSASSFQPSSSALNAPLRSSPSDALSARLGLSKSYCAVVKHCFNMQICDFRHIITSRYPHLLNVLALDFAGSEASQLYLALSLSQHSPAPTVPTVHHPPPILFHLLSSFPVPFLSLSLSSTYLLPPPVQTSFPFHSTCVSLPAAPAAWLSLTHRLPPQPPFTNNLPRSVYPLVSPLPPFLLPLLLPHLCRLHVAISKRKSPIFARISSSLTFFLS